MLSGNRYRKMRRLTEHDLNNPDLVNAFHFEPFEHEDMVLDTLESLDEKYVDIIKMRMYERLTFNEIANRLEYADPSGAYRFFKAAVEKLKQAMLADPAYDIFKDDDYGKRRK